MDHPLLVAVIAGLLTIIVVANRTLRPHPITGIPHNPITSRWGDALAAKESVEKHGDIFEDEAILGQMARKLGPVSQLLIGPVTKLLVSDVRVYEDLMLRSKNKCLEQPDSVKLKIGTIIPNGMVTLPENDMWKRHRRMLVPLMGSNYLGGMAEQVARNARALINLWTAKTVKVEAVGGQCFPCDHDLVCSTLDSVSFMTVGRSLDTLPHEAAQMPTAVAHVEFNGSASFDLQPHPLYTVLRYFLPFLDMSVMLPKWFVPIWSAFVRWRPSYRRNHRTVLDFIDRCTEELRTEVREARSIGAEPGTVKSFIGMIVGKEGDPTQEAITQNEIYDECLGFLLAGNDTTAAALQWGLKYLTNAPDVQRRLRDELLSALDDMPEARLLTYADVSSGKTPYLEAVVHEVLRCARTSQGTVRQTCAPVDILGHNIPAGVEILFTNSVACRMATKKYADRFEGCDIGLWDDGDVATFNPSRWLDEGGKFNPKAGYSFPFGLGLRSCAGKPFALLELRIYIAMLNLAFFFDKIPEPLNDLKPMSYGLGLIPVHAYIAPKPWSEVV